MFGMYISASGAQAYSQFLDVVSNNIANADTPGFKAKDVAFRKVLAGLLGDGALVTTHERHWDTEYAVTGGEVFSIPYNPSVDGNTVEIGLEQAKYGKASVEYQATLDFLRGRVNAYRRALKGE